MILERLRRPAAPRLGLALGALAGVLSVALLFDAVRRSFGRVAGLVAAAVMALNTHAQSARAPGQVGFQMILERLRRPAAPRPHAQSARAPGQVGFQ